MNAVAASQTCELRAVTAHSKAEARKVIEHGQCEELELDYAEAWRHSAELSRLGLQHGVRVVSRGVDYIAVASLPALMDGLAKDKSTYRQRNLYCGFPLSLVPPEQLKLLVQRAIMYGDHLFDIGHLRSEPHETWA